MGKIAVTGGAGFIGSSIAKAFLKKGEEVYVIDDLSAGSKQNLAGLDIGDNCIWGDLKDQEFAQDSLNGVDTVYHFAADIGNVAYLHGSKSKELAALEANVRIDTNVFRACIANKVKKIIYASSVAAYPQDPTKVPKAPFKEDDIWAKMGSRISPEGGYGWAKYLGERQLESIEDIKIGIARIFYIYGPGIYIAPDRSQVIATLMRKAINYPKEGFVVWGDGTRARSFLYIDDFIDALFRLDSYVESNGNLAVNIGATEEITIAELSKMIVGISGKRIPITFDATKPAGAHIRKPDLRRIEDVLGWRQKTNFQTGLKLTYEWAKSAVKSTK